VLHVRLEHGVERVLRRPHKVAEFLAELALARRVPDEMAVFDKDLGVLENLGWLGLGLCVGRGE
jgi:hypothetical protein